MPIRDGLRERGITGIIVSEEPKLPRTEDNPDAKVDAFLDASDALVALCAPDDDIADGSVQCRQNIINEIERAKGRPHLRHRVQVFKEATVRPPSNLGFVHEPLEIDDPGVIVERIVAQLRSWGRYRERTCADPHTR